MSFRYAPGSTVILTTLALMAGHAVADECFDDCEPQRDDAIGQPGMNFAVWKLSVYAGDVVAGGVFTTAGGQTVNHIARWDGCTEPPTTGDLSSAGMVNVLDLLILLEEWGTCAAPDECPADLNGDSVINVLDLLILLENWG